MTDIVERLRNVFPIGREAEMRHEAADEIERLRGRVAVYEIDTTAAEYEIERLREALHQALRLHDIEQAERPTPNAPVWVEEARALLTEGGR